MTYITMSPARELEQFQRHIQRILGDTPSTADWTEEEHVPRMDVYENSTHLFVDFDLPGVSKEDIKLTIHDGVLTLSGERKWSNGTTKLYRRECRYGRFSRSINLPVDVDSHHVEAKVNNGVLHIALAKANPKDIERTIDIR